MSPKTWLESGSQSSRLGEQRCNRHDVWPRGGFLPSNGAGRIDVRPIPNLVRPAPAVWEKLAPSDFGRVFPPTRLRGPGGRLDKLRGSCKRARKRRVGTNFTELPSRLSKVEPGWPCAGVQVANESRCASRKLARQCLRAFIQARSKRN